MITRNEHEAISTYLEFLLTNLITELEEHVDPDSSALLYQAVHSVLIEMDDVMFERLEDAKQNC